jgi:predicted GNAT family acetyltransferase
MLATGRYVGIRRQDRLVCVAGVHVYSPTFGVAALGNVATLPELRGQGLARGACAALCLLLLADGIETIALNVRAGNAAAIASYSRLGFEVVAEYTEASLVAE